MAEAYSDFAAVYDELMDNIPYAEWCETLIQFIDKYGISKPVRGENALPQDEASGTAERGHMDELLASERNLVLDLGCGTGTLTELLSRRGYDMIGVDNSQDMLRIAIEKREKSESPILYLCQDMRELDLYSTVGTVISICDSINYLLKEEEVVQVFKLVNNYLYPGGIFIFDFNTVYKYEQVIGDATIAENREDCSFIWENFYDPQEKINEYDLTIFVREQGRESFRRFFEAHYQKGYTLAQMQGFLAQAGLEMILALDGETHKAPSDTSERIYIVAREGGKS